MATKEEGFIKMWLRKKKDLLRCGYERRRIIKMRLRKKKDLLRCGYERRRIY